MKLCSAIGILIAGKSVWAAGSIDYNSAPPNLSTLANASLFDTWRPKAHVLPPDGQIGDPCMHYTDPKTGLFHVGFLHESLGIASVTTGDLATYRDLNADGYPSIVYGGENDPIAVFDGSVIPSGINGSATLIYTAVKFMPIHWSIPYSRGAETQALAVSTDGGRNFTKLDQGPVIPDPPFAANVTAFRDPYVFQNSKLDTTLKSPMGTWYVAISGGIHNDGPSQFLYRQHDPEFQYWEYLGEWWHEPANSTWGSGKWAGRWGYNFEVGNVFSLNDEGYSVDGEIFVTLGVEWSPAPVIPQVSAKHDMLWAAGTLSNDGSVKFTPTMAGRLDCGLSAYAAAGNIVPSTSAPSFKSGAPDRFISYVWLTGDLYSMDHDFPTAQQNWSGALLLPRELSTLSIPNVVDNELAREPEAAWRVDKSQSGTLELKTLGIAIARETYKELLSGQPYTEPERTLSSVGVVPFKRSPSTRYFVMTAKLSFPQSARNSSIQAGFEVLSSSLETTTIYYQFSNETIIVDRSKTSAAANTTGFNSANEAGHLRLFDVIQDGQQQIETLDLTIVVDNSILEVYANGRLALGTWARSWYANSTDIRFFHNGVDQVTYGNVTLHEGLYNAWPDRK